MSLPDQARQTQLNKIQTKTGKSLDQVRKLIGKAGPTRHNEIRQMLMDELALGYGDANTLAHFAMASDGQGAAEAGSASTEAVVAGTYAGAKAPLRSIHEKLMLALGGIRPVRDQPQAGLPQPAAQ